MLQLPSYFTHTSSNNVIPPPSEKSEGKKSFQENDLESFLEERYGPFKYADNIDTVKSGGRLGSLLGSNGFLETIRGLVGNERVSKDVQDSNDPSDDDGIFLCSDGLSEATHGFVGNERVSEGVQGSSAQGGDEGGIFLTFKDTSIPSRYSSPPLYKSASFVTTGDSSWSADGTESGYDSSDSGDFSTHLETKGKEVSPDVFSLSEYLKPPSDHPETREKEVSPEVVSLSEYLKPPSDHDGLTAGKYASDDIYFKQSKTHLKVETENEISYVPLKPRFYAKKDELGYDYFRSIRGGREVLQRKHKYTMIWFHGFDDQAGSWRDILGRLKQLEVPHMDETKIITPKAKKQCHKIWRIKSSTTGWAPIRGIPPQNEDLEAYDRSVAMVHDLIKKEIEEHKVNPTNILIGGFSQGGALAARAFLSFPVPLGGLMASSWLLGLKTGQLGEAEIYRQNKKAKGNYDSNPFKLNDDKEMSNLGKNIPTKSGTGAAADATGPSPEKKKRYGKSSSDWDYAINKIDTGDAKENKHGDVKTESGSGGRKFGALKRLKESFEDYLPNKKKADDDLAVQQSTYATETPIFIGHGRFDLCVRYPLAKEGERVLKEKFNFNDITFKPYYMGHDFPVSEFADIGVYMKKFFATAERRNLSK